MTAEKIGHIFFGNASCPGWFRRSLAPLVILSAHNLGYSRWLRAAVNGCRMLQDPAARRALITFASAAVLFWSDMALCQVKVGIVAPLTGPFAPWGKMIVDGAKLAETAINAGINTSGEKLELIIRDDQSNPARALEASKQLAVLDKVSALVGCPSSVAALASAPVASDNNLLMISFATGSSVTEKSRNILRLMGREDRLIRTVADHIAVKFLGKRVGAWLAPELAFARGLIESRGVKIENSATIESAEPELPAWIGQLDVVVASPIAARAIRQAPPGKPTFLMPSTLLDASLAPLLPLPNFIAITNPGADFFEAGPAIALNSARYYNLDKAHSQA